MPLSPSTKRALHAIPLTLGLACFGAAGVCFWLVADARSYADGSPAATGVFVVFGGIGLLSCLVGLGLFIWGMKGTFFPSKPRHLRPPPTTPRRPGSRVLRWVIYLALGYFALTLAVTLWIGQSEFARRAKMQTPAHASPGPHGARHWWSPWMSH